jgi:hypothetical protein
LSLLAAFLNLFLESPHPFGVLLVSLLAEFSNPLDEGGGVEVV